MKATHQIIDIHPQDAFYGDLKVLKGKRGFFKGRKRFFKRQQDSSQKGYYSGTFIFARHWEDTKEIGFLAVKIKKL